MRMDENTRILRDYYIFTIPQITVFVGAVLGLLFVLRIDVHLALGIFSLLYGIMLLAIHAVVFQHFRSNRIYRLGLLFSLVLIATGLFLVYTALSNL
ncbi:hypothetical protein [Thermococcus sp. AM4]|uniref:hypothetical protein n=1 Tax=Thermococcus sp. (strain AM4) TaxID=246969 RepID=UPI001ED95B46|nr:hypothetical protein [Thermococcus sp. AM4]